MRALLSTIGSRGDVQPLLALAQALRALGHESTLCVPPTFTSWVEELGFACVPIGPDVKPGPGNSVPVKLSALPKAKLQAMAEGTVRTQFQAVMTAAQGVDLIVGANALQVAAPSIAETLGVPYVFAAYAPVTLPSPEHAPPKMGSRHWPPLPGALHRLMWRRDARHWNARWGPVLNAERAKLGLAPVRDVRRYVLTERPWLAADAALAPAPRGAGTPIVQTGAWLLSDPTPLPEQLERFLAAGEPPVYFGFGSMRGAEQTGALLLAAARALGRRAVVLQGWSNVGVGDGGDDCLSVGDVDHAKLLPRVAAAVHHGGAGTTTAAARAGVPQVVVPHHYDQIYWARRVKTLGIGAWRFTRDGLTRESLIAALRAALRPDVSDRARDLARRVELHGAGVAARRLVQPSH